MKDTEPAHGPGPGSAADADLVYDDTPAPPGRRVRLEPTPPGFWRLLLGSVLALLAPFFGILIGSTLGAPDSDSRMDPLYWGFFIGGLIGVLGLVAAGLGGRVLIRHSRARNREDEP